MRLKAWGAVAGAVVLGLAGCGRAPATRSAAGFNLLLVTLDTVRADHVGAWGYRGGETPNLDRLAAEGVRFAEAETPVPLTLPSHATILSGLLPPEHGLRNNGVGRFPAAPATLATDLAAAGYRTGAFIAAFVLDHRYGLNRGFAIYDDDIPRDTVAGLDARRPGRVVVDRALEWMDRGATKPFFAWVHLYDAHAPYASPEPFATRFAATPYDGGIAEDDAQLGRLLADLDRRGLAARTVVAVVGDHGEELGEHGELTHGLLLYEPSLHVPLIVRAPGVLPAGSVVGTPVSLVDLGPTLAGLLDRPLVAPAGRALDGRDLSVTLRRRREPSAVDLYSESMYGTSFGWSPVEAIRRGDLKYIAAPRPELYNLARDPHEATNLATNRPREAHQLAAALTAMTSSASQAASPADTLDSEARAKLLSLGYLAGASLTTNSTSGHAGKDPKDAIVLLQRFDEAHAAFVAGKTGLARHEFERLVAADPGNPVFVGQLAELCRRTGDLPRAVALYRRAVAIAPSDRDARYNLAVTLQEAGRGDEAFAALKDAIRLDPGRPEAHNALGIALALRGDLEGARSEFATHGRARPPRRQGAQQPGERAARPQAPGRGGRGVPARDRARSQLRGPAQRSRRPRGAARPPGGGDPVLRTRPRGGARDARGAAQPRHRRGPVRRPARGGRRLPGVPRRDERRPRVRAATRGRAQPARSRRVDAFTFPRCRPGGEAKGGLIGGEHHAFSSFVWAVAA